MAEQAVNQGKKILPSIIVGLIVIIVLAVAYWFWSKSKQAPEASSLGSQIFDQTQNPLAGQVPDTNPFKDQKNPLDSIYKNPFE